MVATLALGASAERRGGSSPSIRTKLPREVRVPPWAPPQYIL